MRPSPRKISLLFGLLAFLALAGCAAAIGPQEARSDPAQCVWENVERVVAVGDIHGDRKALVAILQEKGLIDEGERWIGGKAHFVQIGDVMDRGDFAKGALELIRGLEKQAADAGGMIHFLPGNHEEMNIAGISLSFINYVTYQQFVDFLPASVARQHDRWTRGLNSEDKKAYWGKLMKDEDLQRMYYRGFRSEFGGWIAKHNVIIKINGVVFVHGGISLADSRRSLESINDRYKLELGWAIRERLRPEDLQVVYQPTAPLWNRDLTGVGDSSIIKSDVAQILSNLKARAIVIGHTPMESSRLFDGLVFVIDTNISYIYGSNSRLSALEIDRNGVPQWWEQNHVKRNEDQGLGTFLRGVLDLLLRIGRLPAAGHA